MKKFLKTFLLVILILSLVLTTAFAVPKGYKDKKEKNTKVKGVTKEYFTDIEGYEWAKRNIVMMAKKNIIKGRGNGIFSPRSSAKEIETIIMCLRIMDWEDELPAIPELPRGYKSKNYDNWMISYIQMAFEKGLISEEELSTFNPNTPTKRSKAAVYIVRALGLEEEAIEHMDVVLDFNDYDSIPSEHIGYVYVVNELGYMIGFRNNFNPNKPITRAELAVLLSRVSDNVDTENSYTIKGIIAEIDDDSIKIKVNSRIIQLDLSEDVEVYINDLESDITDLEVKMNATLRILNNEVIEIDVKDEDEDDDTPKVYVRYSGIIDDIDRDNDENITNIDITTGSGTTLKSLTLDENALIKIDSKEDDLLDTHIGLETVVIVNNDIIYKMSVKLNELCGSLEDIILTNGVVSGIKIIPESSTIQQEFDFADNVEIIIDDEEDEISYEYIGNSVKLKLLGDDTITKLYIETD